MQTVNMACPAAAHRAAAGQPARPRGSARDAASSADGRAAAHARAGRQQNPNPTPPRNGVRVPGRATPTAPPTIHAALTGSPPRCPLPGTQQPAVTQPGAQPPAAQPPAIPPETPPAAAPPTSPPARPRPRGTTPAQVTITPPGTEFRAGGGPYTVPVSVNNASRISTITLTITYNPAILRARTATDGTFMRQGGVTASFTPRMNTGRVDIVIARAGDQTGANGSGLLAGLLFEAVAPGSSTIRSPRSRWRQTACRCPSPRRQSRLL